MGQRGEQEEVRREKEDKEKEGEKERKEDEKGEQATPLAFLSVRSSQSPPSPAVGPAEATSRALSVKFSASLPALLI